MQQIENKTQNIKDEERFFKALSGMASIYNAMFIIDTEAEELVQLDNDEQGTILLSKKQDYKEKLGYYIENIVSAEYRDLAEIFSDIDMLSLKLKKRNTIYCDLVGKEIGWFRAQFVVINRNEEGVADRFVFTTQVIDVEKKEAEEHQRIIVKLAETYHTMHLFDLENDDCKEIDTVDMLHKVYNDEKNNGAQSILHTAMRATVRPEHLDMMLEFTDFSTLDERMRGRKVIAIDFHGSVNGWAKGQFIEYERDKNGQLLKVLFVTQIIEEEKRKEEELIKTSTTDELTGLFNRRAYEEVIDDIRNKRRTLSFVLWSLDVNGLKAVNDDIGHDAGDELLQGAAEVLLRCLGPYGKVFRIGGDEFNAIIFANESELRRIEIDLDNSMLEWKGKMVDTLSISYGYVSSDEFSGISIDEIEKIADKRMYECKENYYRHGGQDRRSQKEAFDMICKSYIKILSVNLTEDSYRIIKTNSDEMNEENGYSDVFISKWLYDFATSGQVHADDLENFIERTNIDYLRKYFTTSDKDFFIRYRRKSGNSYQDVIMEMVKTDNFTAQNMEVFLYVKNISE